MKEKTAGQSPAKKRTRADKMKHQKALELKRSKIANKKKLEKEHAKKLKRAEKVANKRQKDINQNKARTNAKRREIMDIVNEAEREGSAEGKKGLFNKIKGLFK